MCRMAEFLDQVIQGFICVRWIVVKGNKGFDACQSRKRKRVFERTMTPTHTSAVFPPRKLRIVNKQITPGCKFVAGGPSALSGKFCAPKAGS